MKKKILEISDLAVTFETDEGIIKAVDKVSFHMQRGEIVGLVGESGCGKSVTALSILRLIPSPPGRIENGKIIFKDKDLMKLDYSEMQKIRGMEISMIFQEPSSALSPLHRIGDQLVEAILIHMDSTKKKAWEMAEHWLKRVKLPDAGERMFAYPHELSGGMQQRVMIAMALMPEPDLIIADEPTTALDVTIQLQVLELIREMKRSDTSILLITHDMGVVWEMCDRVIVMYASMIAEEGKLSDIFLNPAHPYTRGLLQSIPKFDCKRKKLFSIPGQVPSPFNYPAGCHFYDRCIYADEICKTKTPEFIDLGNGHKAACFFAGRLHLKKP